MERDDLPTALACLARGLQGAIDVAGLDHLPRPRFAPAVGTSSPTPVSAAPDLPAAAPTALSPAPPALTQPVATATPAPIAATLAPIAATLPPTMPTMPTMPTTLASTQDPAALLLARIPSMAVPPAEKLRILRDDVIGDCTRCKLHRGRNKLVFGAGDPKARLVFVGEGPGADEDREGIPFVGRAGQLLTKMINAMGFSRDDVYICNVVKCRPPNNRDPEADEVEACESFLKAQLAVLQPQVIVALGRHANHTLLRTQTPISKLRGRWHSYEGVDVMPTYHPSYLLREERDPTQTKKREAWGDLQLVMKKLGGQP